MIKYPPKLKNQNLFHPVCILTNLFLHHLSLPGNRMLRYIQAISTPLRFVIPAPEHLQIIINPLKIYSNRIPHAVPSISNHLYTGSSSSSSSAQSRCQQERQPNHPAAAERSLFKIDTPSLCMTVSTRRNRRAAKTNAQNTSSILPQPSFPLFLPLSLSLYTLFPKRNIPLLVPSTLSSPLPQPLLLLTFSLAAP